MKRISNEKESNSNTYFSNENIFNIFNKEFMPLASTITVLAPLNRMKIIIQTYPLISINENEKVYRPLSLVSKIFREQGIFSFWRGNSANIYKQFIISYTNVFTYNLFKKSDENKSIKEGFFNRLYFCSITSTLNSILTYPFEIANTRMSADMTRLDHKKLNSSSLEVFTKILGEDSISRNRIILNFSFTRLYKGFFINVLSNTIYWTMTLGCFEKLENYFKYKKQKAGDDFEYYLFIKRMYIIFGATTINTIFASLIIYPLDTFKRHIQVNESIGFNSEYSNSGILNAFKKFMKQRKFYNGLSLHLLKILPFSMIQYSFYSYFNDGYKNIKN